MAKIGILKGFVQGSVWSGRGNSRVFLPFQDTILEAKFMYSGETVEAKTFSDAGILGTSNSCLQSEEAGFEMSTQDISWSLLQAATLSSAVTRTSPVLVTETFTASTVVGDDSTVTLSATPVVNNAAAEDIYGLPDAGFSVADIDGKQLVATLAGSVVTLDGDLTGTQVTVQYLRAPLAQEEVIYLGAGERRQEVGVYGKFFGCPGSLLIVAPKCAVVPSLDFGVSGGNTATAGLKLQCIRSNGYFAEITRLKDCVNC